MKATTEQLTAAYNEAKNICESYINYKGDKRTIYYKSLTHAVVDLYMDRMNNFGRKLGLPLFDSLYNM